MNPPATFNLAELVSDKTATKLNTDATRFLKTAERWWREERREINQDHFLEAIGARSHYSFQKLEIHHSDIQPRDVWDYLAFLQIAAKARQKSLPDPIPAAIGHDLIDELRKKNSSLVEIDKWKKEFPGWLSATEQTIPRHVELRLQLHSEEPLILARDPETGEFSKAKLNQLRECDTDSRFQNKDSTLLDPGSTAVLRAILNPYGAIQSTRIEPFSDPFILSLSQLVQSPELLRRHVIDSEGNPVSISESPLVWRIDPPGNKTGENYTIDLVDSEGRSAAPPLAILPGTPRLYVSHRGIHSISVWPFKKNKKTFPLEIPPAALETHAGIAAISELGVPLPPHLESRIRRVPLSIRVKLAYENHHTQQLLLTATAFAKDSKSAPKLQWDGTQWWHPRNEDPCEQSNPDSPVTIVDKSTLAPATEWLQKIPFKSCESYYSDHIDFRLPSKAWPRLFHEWLASRPDHIELLLDRDLASLRDGAIAGRVTIDLEASSDIDWFDLSVALKVDDTTLTQDEIDLLLKSRGEWVRLDKKGWRKLDFEMTDEQIDELADLGLASRDFSDEKQRLHALQLGALSKKKSTLLEPARVEQVQRRIEEIHTRVTPPAPTEITATLRPYQLDGFHFLAYLTENRFGGVLADDMGLGKTLQALCWLAWLRTEKKLTDPALVVCPKSVQDNWRTEAQRFLPGLRVEVWNGASAGTTGLDGTADLLVIHYAQLRAHEEKLRATRWGAIILDEAQNIKNPTSQTARAACNLPSPHRLALTGTPIENRLLDLWSIFQFAMPGILGQRTSFLKNFDNKEDPFARRRLAARTRPFLLRRTKTEVASDLPERIEEDIVVELEGIQAKLYQAELKRARAQLLKAETDKQLDKLRFHILTSLLRLRQICCHPLLLGLDEKSEEKSTPKKKSKKTSPAPSQAAPEADSAKLSALLDLIEPLMEEGQKVIVFSQFLEMLTLVGQALATREWKTFRLDGNTEDRGNLVQEFQTHDGPATFLISLKAGGSGLNLTAASYVILFDPWWNPAVEAQAIDRTHRIGQKQTVFAYRLLVKNTIEEKIRHLQKKKSNLARDILGEENFAQALTLSDFHFLLGEDQ